MDEETYHRAMACLHLIRAELSKIGKIQVEQRRSEALNDSVQSQNG